MTLQISVNLVKTSKPFLISYETSRKITPASVYLFKINNGNTRTMFKVNSKLIIKTKISLTVSLLNIS